MREIQRFEKPEHLELSCDEWHGGDPTTLILKRGKRSFASQTVVLLANGRRGGSMAIPHMDSRFRQQQLRSCRFFVSPLSAVVIYLIFALICLGAGISLRFGSESLFELPIDYPQDCESDCVVPFSVSERVKGPLYIYYELTNFYQNSFVYSKSEDWDQLRGLNISQDPNDCDPVVKDSSNRRFLPCGAVPYSVFNDTFNFSEEFPESLTKDDISTPQFRSFFQNPTAGSADNQWLNESGIFPGGQTNEQFINWVRIAPFSTFRKLWAKTTDSSDLVSEENYTVNISNNYPVSSFTGRKRLIISQVGVLGGANSGFPALMIVLGAISLAGSCAFGILGRLKSCAPTEHSVVSFDSELCPKRDADDRTF
jgi:hypothetical protein